MAIVAHKELTFVPLQPGNGTYVQTQGKWNPSVIKRALVLIYEHSKESYSNALFPLKKSTMEARVAAKLTAEFGREYKGNQLHDRVAIEGHIWYILQQARVSTTIQGYDQIWEASGAFKWSDEHIRGMQKQIGAKAPSLKRIKAAFRDGFPYEAEFTRLDNGMSAEVSSTAAAIAHQDMIRRQRADAVKYRDYRSPACRQHRFYSEPATLSTSIDISEEDSPTGEFESEDSSLEPQEFPTSEPELYGAYPYSGVAAWMYREGVPMETQLYIARNNCLQLFEPMIQFQPDKARKWIEVLGRRARIELRMCERAAADFDSEEG